jgi:phosphate-selective porin OprO/OprP
MPRKHTLALGAVVGASLFAAGPAGAQTASVSKQIDALQQQIQQLQQQLQSLQTEVKASHEEAQAAETQAAQAKAAAAAPAATPASTPHVIQSGSNQFGLASADGRNSIELTGRLQLDYGDYINYSKASSATSLNDLNSGENARRARIGVAGTFLGDWKYALIYDFGGSSDSLSPLISGAGASGIENAYIEYVGIPQVAIDLGYMDTPYSLDEPTGSGDLMFLERSSAQVVAANIAAGDNRATFGFHWNNDRIWLGAYATGPTSGAAHTLTVTTLAAASSASTKLTCPVKGASATCTVANTAYGAAYGGSAEQTGAFGRVAVQALQGDGYSLHVGGDIESLIQPAHTSSGIRGLTLSDRPELRVDPTSLIGLTISNVSDAEVYSGEAAASLGPFFIQGEFFNFNIDRDTDPSISLNGGYVEAAIALTGETRKYNPATGAYRQPNPTNPFGWSDGGFTGAGAWELAARFSEIDLNDSPKLAEGKAANAGGDQTVYTVGLNWYVNSNVKFQFDYEHGDIDKPVANSKGTALVPGGQTFDALAARAQVLW